MITLFAMLTSQAATVQQRVCVRLETDYDELIPNGTWWTTNVQRAMSGIEVRVETAPGQGVPPVLIGFGGIAGSDSGCVTFVLDDSISYGIRVMERARVVGRDIFAVDSNLDDINDVVGTFALLNWTPTGVTRTVVLPYSRRRGAVAIGAWMFRRNSFGLSASGHPLKIVSNGGPSTNASTQRVLINTDRKRAISHEIGHWIAMRRDEVSGSASNSSASTDNCQGWGTSAGSDDLSKEHDSWAAQEGWADYVAAWAWNTQNANRCTLQREVASLPDFDLDGDGDSPPHFAAGIPSGQWSCEGEPNDFNTDGDWTDPGEPLWAGWAGTSNFDVPSPALTASDWLQDRVLANDALGCAGTVVGRTSKVDWVRFWWDFCRDYNITVAQCTSVLDAANPRNWDPSTDGQWPRWDDPIRRIESAANSLGFQSEFILERHNGLDHY